MYFVSIDTEATGINKFTDNVVELGGVIEHVEFKSANEVVRTPLDVFTMHCNPHTVKMAGKASEITGITQEFLNSKPHVSVILNAFVAWVNRTCVDDKIPRVLVTYNGDGYDLPLIASECARIKELGIQRFFRSCRFECHVDALTVGRRALDTTTLIRRKNGTCSYKLGDVYKSTTGKVLEGAHGAVADSRAVLDVCFGRQDMVEAVYNRVGVFLGCLEDDEHCDVVGRTVMPVLVKGVCAMVERHNSRVAKNKATGCRTITEMLAAARKKRGNNNNKTNGKKADLSQPAPKRVRQEHKNEPNVQEPTVAADQGVLVQKPDKTRKRREDVDLEEELEGHLPVAARGHPKKDQDQPKKNKPKKEEVETPAAEKNT